jgi:hypothetical protein
MIVHLSCSPATVPAVCVIVKLPFARDGYIVFKGHDYLPFKLLVKQAIICLC